MQDDDLSYDYQDEGLDEPYVKVPGSHPDVSEYEDLGNGRARFVVTCDDGMEVEVEKLAKKLSKRLSKFGQSMDIVKREEGEKPSWFKPNVMLRIVRLTIETPTISGKTAKLIGSFDMAEDGEQVYRYAFHGHTEADLEPYLSRWRDCDHCKHNRNRKSTFLCETTEGERVLIGRQCSMDYLGLDPSDILAREAAFRSFGGGGGDEDEEGVYPAPSSAFRNYLHTGFLVQTAYRVAKRLGGYSREIRDRFISEVDALYGAKDFGKSTFYADIRRWYAAHPLNEEIDYYALADYVYKQQGLFWQDVRIALEMPNIKLKRRVMVIAGIGLFVGKILRDAANPKVEKPVQKPMEGVEKDQRVEFEGTVVSTRPYMTDFGPKCAITILTDKGESCVHFSAKEINPDAGKRYRIKATVTKQDEVKKQTVLARAVYNDVSEQLALGV